MPRIPFAPAALATASFALLLALPGALAQAGDPAPDLSVADLTFAPAQPRAGDAVVFTAQVRNDGNETAGHFNVSFFVDDASVGKAPVAGLGPGQAIDVPSPPWNATAGNHTVRAVADADGDVAESDEHDNERSEPVAVLPAPAADLVVLSLSPSPGAPRVGDSVTFLARVKNQGDADAGAFEVGFEVDGTAVGTTAVPGLAAGAELNVASPSWTAAGPGAHTAEATADAGGDVVEHDEGNNTLSQAFQVLPTPAADLRIAALDPSPAAPHGGQAVVFAARVVNDGDAAAGPFDVRFIVDGVLLGDVAVAGLAAGAEVNVASPTWTATAGTHTIKAIADAAAEVPESDETDNERTLDLTVPPVPAPDLTVVEITLAPAAPTPGDDVTFRATVRNDGSAAAGAFEVRFLLDGAFLGDVPVAGLAAAASVEVASPLWDAARGEHTVRAIADVGAKVAEADEADNERTERFRVPSAQAAKEPDEGDDDEGDEGEGAGEEKVALCHAPPGHPGNAHTITVGAPAAEAHRAHGDRDGPCAGSEAESAAAPGAPSADAPPRGHGNGLEAADHGRGPPEQVPPAHARGHDEDGPPAAQAARAEPHAEASMAALGAAARAVPGPELLAILGVAGLAALAARGRRG